jgi:hypothetical protein
MGFLTGWLGKVLKKVETRTVIGIVRCRSPVLDFIIFNLNCLAENILVCSEISLTIFIADVYFLPIPDRTNNKKKLQHLCLCETLSGKKIRVFQPLKSHP